MTLAVEPRDAPVPDGEGHWPAARSPILDWLVGEARLLPNGRSLLLALCERLVAAGLPLARPRSTSLHPQLFGMGYYWERGRDDIRVFRAEHGIQETSVYQQSPMRILFEALARAPKIDLPDVASLSPFYELRDQLTDYVALPVTFSDGKAHGTTLVRSPGRLHHRRWRSCLLPVFSLLLEIYLNHASRSRCWTPAGHAPASDPARPDHPRQR
jgi:adenylate cyclase